MEFVLMGENRGIDDFADSTSKLGSIIQINSIAIDISSSMEAMESPVHEHFSIRGFVAGMRKKDQKICFPFTSPGVNDVDLVDYLPPLYVPKVRCWRCSSCTPTDEMKRTAEETAALTLNDATTSSSESVGAKDGFFIRTRKNTDGNVLPHRRKPKLRSLADIMVEERNKTSSNLRTRSSSSCGMQVASSEMESVLVRQFKVDVSADVVKADQSSEWKRKIALAEDREPLAAICPRGTVKRIKGLELDSEKNSTRVELISDPESKGDASVRLDLPRTQKIKSRKAKAIDTNKNLRPIHRYDEKSLTKELLQPNNVSSANLQERVVPVETNPGENCRRGTDDDDTLLPLRKNVTENCNTRGTVALDLSLNSFMDAEGNQSDQASLREHRCIPDLNVEYTGTTAVTEEQQSTILSEKSSLPLQKTSETSASCSYGTVREGKQISCPKNKDTVMELNPADDIPMEIERALGNSSRHPRGITDATKGYSASEGVTGFPLPSRNGSKVSNRLSSSSSPSQQRKPEYATSASTMAGPSSVITWEELLYSSARENVPFPQLNHYKAFLDEHLKGRSIVEGKKAVANTSLGSLDPYSDDMIAATRLLSLVDQRVKSDSSPNVGMKSSSDNKMRVNGKENRNFLRSSFGASSSFRVEVPQEARNSKSNEELGECVINRNPADFSIPEVGNEFTINAKDLRFRKRNNAIREKLRRTNVDGRKRRRMRKNGSERESLR